MIRIYLLIFSLLLCSSLLGMFSSSGSVLRDITNTVGQMQLRFPGTPNYRIPEVVLEYLPQQQSPRMVLIQSIELQGRDAESINLSGRMIDDNLLLALLPRLPQRTLLNLDLSNNLITDSGAEGLALFIRDNHLPQMQVLKLEANQITQAGVAAVADAIEFAGYDEPVDLDVDRAQ